MIYLVWLTPSSTNTTIFYSANSCSLCIQDLKIKKKIALKKKGMRTQNSNGVVYLQFLLYSIEFSVLLVPTVKTVSRINIE